MTDDSQGRRKGQIKVWLALTTMAVILTLLIVPPYVSISRYRSRITQLVSVALGRPVRLSSVELRMLPRPSFVITDLTVQEDPAYGAEPVLHATTVTASIRLLPLWRGSIQISRISVDEASVNLVRTGAGQWNFDAFFRTAATRSGSGAPRSVPFPYLEATNSRINIKNGVEKLPYSLVSADISFWQENPGDWRVRMRGQPARTDVSLDMPDTGVVRLEASLRRAPELRDMPLHVDIDWREAQLGQLSRLIIGSDKGWRGDLAGEMHVDGTAASAQVRTRLRASGVHRAEFTPASPMDFDASCAFLYHYSQRSVENLACESPVGSGRARLTGALPGNGERPKLTVEMDRVPAQAGLDALRTLRSGLDSDLQADGAVSGKISYDPDTAAVSQPPIHSSPVRTRRQPPHSHGPAPGPLTGALTVIGLRLSGDGLTKPIQIPRVTLEPDPGEQAAIVATVAIPAGAPSPLSLTARLALRGYQVSIRGGASFSQLLEWAHVAGLGDLPALQKLTGPAAALDLSENGPWLAVAPAIISPADSYAGAAGPMPVLVSGPSDHVTGTMTLHDSAWKPEFLANTVELVSATLRFEDDKIRWDPVSFIYGPVKGTATLSFPSACGTFEKCPPHFDIQFGSLSGASLQAAILGARQSGTLLSSLLDRLRPSSAPVWPQVEGTVRSDQFILGPVTLDRASATLRILPDGAKLDAFTADVLGGHLSATGSVKPIDKAGDKPAYHFDGNFPGLSATQVGQLMGMTWSGSGLDGSGQVDLAGFTDPDLASAAKGTSHFDWRHGAIASSSDEETPSALAKFDRWTADVDIANGGLVLKQNQLLRGTRKSTVEASATFGDPVKVTFAPSQNAQAIKH